MSIKIPKNLFGVDGDKALERILSEREEAQPKPKAQPFGIPLLFSILPDMANKGLHTVFSPDKYEGKTVEELADATLNGFEAAGTESEKEIVAHIRQLLSDIGHGPGYFIFSDGTGVIREATGLATKYAVEDKSDSGTEYLFLKLIAYQPDEAG